MPCSWPKLKGFSEHLCNWTGLAQLHLLQKLSMQVCKHATEHKHITLKYLVVPYDMKTLFTVYRVF